MLLERKRLKDLMRRHAVGREGGIRDREMPELAAGEALGAERRDAVRVPAPQSQTAQGIDPPRTLDRAPLRYQSAGTEGVGGQKDVERRAPHDLRVQLPGRARDEGHRVITLGFEPIREDLGDRREVARDGNDHLARERLRG